MIRSLIIATGLLVSSLAYGDASSQDTQQINRPDNWPKSANPIASGSEESPALKVVQRFFHAYSRGDTQALKQFVAEDIEWHIPGQHPLAGTKRGIEEFSAFFTALAQAGFKAEVTILAANDQYVIDAHRGYSTTATGQIDLNWVLLYQVQHGKIQRVQNFSGDLYASDAFFSAYAKQLKEQH